MASSTAAVDRKRKAETSPVLVEPAGAKTPRLTAEMEEEVKCPICLEVPLDAILQCVNGHTVCQPCQEKTGRDTCGQCRGRMKTPEGGWIRNRTLEKMLDKMAIPCRFQDKGCTQVLPRAELRQHLEECDKSGNVIQICRRFPGGKNCDFKINCTKPQEAIQHLKDHHKGCQIQARGCILKLSFGKARNKINYPALVTSGQAHCLLVIAIDLDDDAVHFLALRLDKTEDKARMKITIKSHSDKVTDLILEIPVVSFLDAPSAFTKPRLVRLSKSLLEEQFRDADTGKVGLIIRI